MAVAGQHVIPTELAIDPARVASALEEFIADRTRSFKRDFVVLGLIMPELDRSPESERDA